MKEEWREIKGYRDTYCVSNLGNVKRKDRMGTRGNYVKAHVLKPHINSNGYLRVGFRDENGKFSEHFIHRLVAELFIPNPENKPCVNHIDGNKLNNSVENLEWCTHSENELHSLYKLGKINNLKPCYGERSHFAKLTNAQVSWIRNNHEPWNKTFGSRPLGKLFGVSDNLIRDCVYGRTYKND